MYKYSLPNMLNEYKKNKPLIDAYLKRQPVEGLKDGQSGLILGMEIGVFLLMMTIGLILFFWALVVSIKYWDRLSDIMKVLLIISWFIAPPILPLIIVYIGKGSDSQQQMSRYRSY